jgi:hypothetical protein
MGWLHWYWAEAGGNVVAMPACAVVAVAFAVGFRRPAARWWRKHFGAQADLAEIRGLAAAAHRIAADTYRHHTGRVHPDAPDTERG